MSYFLCDSGLFILIFTPVPAALTPRFLGSRYICTKYFSLFQGQAPNKVVHVGKGYTAIFVFQVRHNIHHLKSMLFEPELLFQSLRSRIDTTLDSSSRLPQRSSFFGGISNSLVNGFSRSYFGNISQVRVLVHGFYLEIELYFDGTRLDRDRCMPGSIRASREL